MLSVAFVTSVVSVTSQAGEAYVLSNSVRNACLHGVLSDAGSEHRASLNLRFGLHSAEREAEYSAWCVPQAARARHHRPRPTCHRAAR